MRRTRTSKSAFCLLLAYLDSLDELLLLAQDHEVGSLEHALVSERVGTLNVFQLRRLQVVRDCEFVLVVLLIPLGDLALEFGALALFAFRQYHADAAGGAVDFDGLLQQLHRLRGVDLLHAGCGVHVATGGDGLVGLALGRPDVGLSGRIN